MRALLLALALLAFGAWRWYEDNPRRCLKRGHKPRERHYEGYRKPDSFSFRTVAIGVSGTVTECRRCMVELSREEKQGTWYSGVTWPSEMMREFEENGFVEK